MAWYRNMDRYVAKHHGRAASLVLRTLILAGMGMRMVVSTVARDGAAVRAYGAVMREALTGWRQPAGGH